MSDKCAIQEENERLKQEIKDLKEQHQKDLDKLREMLSTKS